MKHIDLYCDSSSTVLHSTSHKSHLDAGRQRHRYVLCLAKSFLHCWLLNILMSWGHCCSRSYLVWLLLLRHARHLSILIQLMTHSFSCFKAWLKTWVPSAHAFHLSTFATSKSWVQPTLWLDCLLTVFPHLLEVLNMFLFISHLTVYIELVWTY